MNNEKLQRKITRMERDVLRYKETLKAELASDDLENIEKSLKAYSQDILSLINTIEELKELI